MSTLLLLLKYLYWLAEKPSLIMLVNCWVQFNIVGLQPELVDDNFEICRVASIRGLQEETVGSLVKGHLKTRLWRPVRESARVQGSSSSHFNVPIMTHQYCEI